METLKVGLDKNFTSVFRIDGMTCTSCESKIEHAVLESKDILSAKALFKTGQLEITALKPVNLSEIKSALAGLKKYTVSELKVNKTYTAKETAQIEKSLFQTYKPLIMVFTFILLSSLSFQFSLEKFSWHLFMNHLMAGFFIGLSFFKFLDLKSFAEAFSNYDPIAQHFYVYGYIYAFIEIMLGLLFLSHKFLLAANALAAVVLIITTIGVVKHLRSNKKFQCACLGAGFNLPLSKVTVAENLAMIFMGVYNLFNILN